MDREMIAYCGLTCDRCPIHLATSETDVARQKKMREEIAVQLAKIYGTVPKPEIISDCDGCKNDNGRIFGPCNECPVRICARERNLINCAWCNEFICEKLENHYKYDLEAKDRLLEIRKNLSMST